MSGSVGGLMHEGFVGKQQGAGKVGKRFVSLMVDRFEILWPNCLTSRPSLCLMEVMSRCFATLTVTAMNLVGLSLDSQALRFPPVGSVPSLRA